MNARTLAVCTLMVCATSAEAGKPYDVHGLIVGKEGARYVKGVPTLDLQQQRGAVQVRSMGFHNNRPVFAIAFYNAGPDPVNIGLEDIHASSDGSSLRVFSVEELERQAKKKAWWKQFGLAMAGGLNAGVAASQRNTYRSTITGPYASLAKMPTFSMSWALRMQQTSRSCLLPASLKTCLSIFAISGLRSTTFAIRLGVKSSE